MQKGRLNCSLHTPMTDEQFLTHIRVYMNSRDFRNKKPGFKNWIRWIYESLIKLTQ